MASIAQYWRPPRLYRYRSLRETDQELDAIANGYVFCSTYSELNDPMEGLYASSPILKNSDDYRAIMDAIKRQKSRLGICSFTEVWDHELMWAHYADQFRGVCVAYSFSKLLKYLPKGVGFVRMFYDEFVPTVRNSGHGPGHQAKMVLSHKNYKWLYEREWRMFAAPGKAYYREVDCVTRVYLGPRIEPDKRNRIEIAMKRVNIKTQSLIVDEYFLSFESRSEIKRKSLA